MPGSEKLGLIEKQKRFQPTVASLQHRQVQIRQIDGRGADPNKNKTSSSVVIKQLQHRSETDLVRSNSLILKLPLRPIVPHLKSPPRAEIKGLPLRWPLKINVDHPTRAVQNMMLIFAICYCYKRNHKDDHHHQFYLRQFHQQQHRGNIKTHLGCR